MNRSRPLLPKEVSPGSPSAEPAEAALTKISRRKLTAVACVHCRLKKIKIRRGAFRGRQPWNKIELLRRRFHHNETVLSALTKPELQRKVFARLRNVQSVDQVSKWLEDTVAEGDAFSPAVVDNGPTLSEPRASQHMDAVSSPLPKRSLDKTAKAKGAENPDQKGVMLSGSDD
ncbi:fungal-specific transcription factor domain-containing protein [Apiospora arundinis]